MKNIIAGLIIAITATAAGASSSTKIEEVKKPAASEVPATPKQMPKVTKPKTKAEKAAEAKAAKEKSNSDSK